MVGQVEQAVQRIMQDKRARGVAPLRADVWELMQATGLPKSEVLQTMRDLHRAHKWRASLDIAGTPMLVEFTAEMTTPFTPQKGL